MNFNLWRIWIAIFGLITCFSILNRVFNITGDIEPAFNIIDKSYEEIFNRDVDLIMNEKKRDSLCLIDDYSYCFCDEMFNVIYYDKKNMNINIGRLIKIVDIDDSIYNTMDFKKNYDTDIRINDEDINNILSDNSYDGKRKIENFMRRSSGQSILLISITKEPRPEISVLARKYGVRLYIMYQKSKTDKNFKYIVHGKIEMEDELKGMNLYYVIDGKIKNYEKVNDIKFNGILTLNEDDKELVSYIAINNRLNKIEL
jgi:hypothetical protein